MEENTVIIILLFDLIIARGRMNICCFVCCTGCSSGVRVGQMITRGLCARIHDGVLNPIKKVYPRDLFSFPPVVLGLGTFFGYAKPLFGEDSDPSSLCRKSLKNMCPLRRGAINLGARCDLLFFWKRRNL